MKQVLEKVRIVPPKVLTVIGAFTENRETYIAIHNPLKQLVAFKIKPSGNISIKPRYGYIPAKREIFLKVKVKGTDNNDASKPAKETVKITLGAVSSTNTLPSKPHEIWHENREPETTLTRTLQVEFKEEDETESANTASDSESISEKSAAVPTKEKEMNTKK